ncbi:MAG: hypothetical protein ABSD80_14020 [Caulobacteraceae bacterium]|jgi:hypothetical protein
MSALLFIGAITLAAVLWAISASFSARPDKPVGPINRKHFEADTPIRATPTTPVRAAAKWLAENSHWGDGRGLAPNSDLVSEQLVERLASGDLNSWGRRDKSSPLVRLQPVAFATGLLDLPADSLFIVDKDATYYDLQLNEDEVKRVWPAKPA